MRGGNPGNGDSPGSLPHRSDALQTVVQGLEGGFGLQELFAECLPTVPRKSLENLKRHISFLGLKGGLGLHEFYSECLLTIR